MVVFLEAAFHALQNFAGRKLALFVENAVDFDVVHDTNDSGETEREFLDCYVQTGFFKQVFVFAGRIEEVGTYCVEEVFAEDPERRRDFFVFESDVLENGAHEVEVGVEVREEEREVVEVDFDGRLHGDSPQQTAKVRNVQVQFVFDEFGVVEQENQLEELDEHREAGERDCGLRNSLFVEQQRGLREAERACNELLEVRQELDIRLDLHKQRFGRRLVRCRLCSFVRLWVCLCERRSKLHVRHDFFFQRCVRAQQPHGLSELQQHQSEFAVHGARVFVGRVFFGQGQVLKVERTGNCWNRVRKTHIFRKTFWRSFYPDPCHNTSVCPNCSFVNKVISALFTQTTQHPTKVRRVSNTGKERQFELTVDYLVLTGFCSNNVETLVYILSTF